MKKISLILLMFVLCSITLMAQPLAESHEKYLGNVINDGSRVRADFLDLWNQVTPENAGKWGSVEGVRDVMNWGNLDKIYKFAKDNNLPFRQHNFIWGQQQPGWFNTLDAESQRDEVEEWIRLFGERYPDTDFIDVVNEPLHENPVYKEAIGGNGSTGWDWVIWSFEKAREYNPTAKLHINEYGVLNGWVSIPNYIKIINLLKERNLIDGIGLQGHFLESTGKSTIVSKLNQLAATGLPIYITEYDVNIADDAQHLARFKEQFPAMFEHPSVEGITFWGYVQGQMWRTDGYLILRDGSDRSAMAWLRNYFSGNTDVASPVDVPTEFELAQNYPNPFNPTTEIRFTLAAQSHVRLDISDALGRSVKTLVDAELSTGSHSMQWDATNDRGQLMPSGVYVYAIHVVSGDKTYFSHKKMLLIK